MALEHMSTPTGITMQDYNCITDYAPTVFHNCASYPTVKLDNCH